MDTRANPPTSSWIHPYDTQEYILRLPESHPANPKSTAAKEARSKYDQLMALAEQKRNQKAGDDSLGSKMRNKLSGTTHNEREAKRIEKQARSVREQEREMVCLCLSAKVNLASAIRI